MTKLKAITKIELAVLLVLSICCGAYAGALFVVLFAGAVRYKGRSGQRGNTAVSLIWMAFMAYLTFCLPRCMLHSEYGPEISLSELILNMLCIFIVCGAVFLISGRVKASVIIGSFLLVLLGTVNAIIYGFVGRELGPADFLSIGTAINVAGQYKLEPNVWIAAGWVMWILSVLILRELKISPNPKPVRRLYIALAMLLSVFIIIVGAKDKPIKTWQTEGTRLNGYYLNFCLALRDSRITVPEGYMPKSVESLSEQYTEQIPDTKKPNVLVIMDESYVDFSGIKPETNIPITPFLDSLTENTIRGRALSSVFGGNTANAEFEFLTGHSMAFLPGDTVPYQQYINSDIYSLAWLMRSYGYKSVATHPYLSDGWSRTKIYPYLGFSEYSFIESYPSKDIIRNYISDREMFEYILDYTHSTEEPLFMFGITMQNHGGFDYKGDNFTKTTELKGYKREYPGAEQYLSLIHETDSAMEYFIGELEKSPEDTVVLFFGDHFPKLEEEFYKELFNKSFNTLDEQMLQYDVPFIIWANYDIEEKQSERTSISYLSNYLLEAAGLCLPQYNRFLKETETVIPRINAKGYYSVSQGGFKHFDDAEGEEAEYLKRYKSVQYNNMFDKENRSNGFFGKYIK